MCIHLVVGNGTILKYYIVLIGSEPSLLRKIFVVIKTMIITDSYLGV